MKVIWKSIPGFHGKYSISNLGIIRIVRRSFQSAFPIGYELTPTVHYRTGYCSVMIKNPKQKPKRMLVHRLVLTAFVSKCPKGMECRHKDGKRTNNRLSNLKWGTRIQNSKDRVRHGTHPIGERNGFSKLSNDQIFAIREQIKVGVKYLDIAKIHKVTPSLISQISLGKIWGHLK